MRKLICGIDGALVTAMALTGMAMPASAAYVHTVAYPSGDKGASGAPGVHSSFSKNTHAFMYLEAESSDRNTNDSWDNPLDTWDNTKDLARTFNRTDASFNSSWYGGESYNHNRFGAYGGDSDLGNINAYWGDLATGLPAGTYDVLIRAFPGGGVSGVGGVETFTLYAGDRRSAVDAADATAVGTVTTTSKGAEGWYRLGTINLTAGVDTFRLKTDTIKSPVRFDTILFAGQVAVPEPTAGLAAAVGGVMLLARRRRRRDGGR